MAKQQLSYGLHGYLDALIQGWSPPSRLTPAVAVRLAEFGVFKIKNRRLVLDMTKAKAVQKRFMKRTRQENCNREVLKAIDTTLAEPGQATQHRAVWNFVGRQHHTREAVLKSLQALRAQGILRTFKASNNNFQVYWARAADEAEVPTFEVNGK